MSENISFFRASLDGASLNRASLDGASLNGASLNGASLNRASLGGASLNRASLDGASLNGASLDEVGGIVVAQCTFAAFGECGRGLTGIVIDGTPKFWSGCLTDKTEEEIREYINRPEQKKYKESHMLGFKFVLSALACKRVTNPVAGEAHRGECVSPAIMP